MLFSFAVLLCWEEVLLCFVRFEFVLVNDLGFEKLIVVFVERTIRLGMDIIIKSIILTLA